MTEQELDALEKRAKAHSPPLVQVGIMAAVGARGLIAPLMPHEQLALIAEIRTLRASNHRLLVACEAANNYGKPGTTEEGIDVQYLLEEAINWTEIT